MSNRCLSLLIVVVSGALLNNAIVIAICPLKCVCKDLISVACADMDQKEMSRLFADESPFLLKYAQKLESFKISRSELQNFSSFPAERFQSLSFLDLSENQLKSLDAAFLSSDFSLPSLTRLHLQGNKLASISRQAFVIFPNVEEICLDGNGIFAIDWEAFRLFRLKRLLLGWNHLPTISEHMLRFTPNLEFLDLSHNQISIAQSSSFFAAQRLKHLDLSFNRIQRFYYDSFSPLFQEFLQLETLDLSFNNLSQIPADLKQFIALRTLNFSGNPLEKIGVGELVQPVLQVLNISHCSRLKLIESRAFTKLPLLQTALFTTNPLLNFVSPSAFANVSSIFELDLSNNALEILGERIAKLPIRLHLNGNPFICFCILEIVKKYQEHIILDDLLTCRTRLSAPTLITIKEFDSQRKVLEVDEQECPREPLTPFGVELVTEVGAFYSIYCSGRLPEDRIVWTFPNGTKIVAGNQTEFSPLNLPNDAHTNFFAPSLSSAPSAAGSPFLSGLFPAQLSPAGQPPAQQKASRVIATNEQLRFETVMQEDAGDYVCRIDRLNGENPHLAPKKNEIKVLKLLVLRPLITIAALEVGSHYVSLAWNGSLNIKASDKVVLTLDVRDGKYLTISRIIQLSLYNPWHSYNVMRLKQQNNYTFCLVYRLNDFEDSKKGIEQLHKLYETCVDTRTKASLSFWNSMNASTVIIISLLGFCFTSLCCFRTLYTRFFIWHDAKLRARMNQSMSGQSFLSHSSSATNGAMSQSVTFENTPQVLNQSTNMSRFPDGSFGSSSNPNARLLTVDVAV